MGGFGNAISGVWGGQYEERLATRRAELDAARRRQMEVNAVLAPLLAERDQLAVAIRQSEARIHDQGVRISQLRAEMSRRQSVSAEQHARLAELESELVSIQERSTALDAYATRISHDDLAGELADIEQNLAQLDADFDQLAAGIR